MIYFPSSTSAYRIADWIELYVLVLNKKISKLKIVDLFDEEGIDLESKIDGIMIEMERRTQLYGPDAPFSINGSTIEPDLKWNEDAFHTLCLIFSAYGVQDVTDGGTILFERVSNVLLTAYLKGESHHLGFPINTKLTDQIDIVAKRSSEARGRLTPNPKEKDSGVDVISWKPFNDSRSGQVIVLSQCGAGADWREKSSIDLRTWNHYINWNYETTIPSMIITQIVEADKWVKYTNKYGVILDRARLYRINRIEPSLIQAGLYKEIFEWCEARLKHT